MNHKYNYKKELKSNKHNKRMILIISVLIILILSLFFILKSCDTTNAIQLPDKEKVILQDEGDSLDGEAQVKTREDILKELEKQQLVVTDKLSSNITFPTGDVGTVGEWIVENLAENNIVQQAEVYLEDILISKSTPIYPNQHITSIQLLENIAPGEYEVLAYLNYYDIETKEFLSKAGYKIHLTVK